jgi:tetraacyldisaccharide 4'-kinase
MRAPAFWDRDGFVPLALTPVSWLWSAAGWMRARSTKPERIPVPVICVGNLTAGGSGKTPTALALLRLLTARANGHPVAHALLRGYGGTIAGPVRIDTHLHTASDVGDEALLLARAAPTWVAHDRIAGALAAAASGARVIVMDDGLQNPALAKTLSLVVVDGATGFGNGRVIPAGPLRESITSGLARADAVIVVGADRAGVTATVTRMQPHLPILSAHLVPSDASLKGQRVYAFAGIGRPEKFFETLREIGVDVVGCRAFDDHHAFAVDELATLEDEARRLDARLVTTEKDYVRLDAITQRRIAALPVELAFDDPTAIDALIAPLAARA